MHKNSQSMTMSRFSNILISHIRNIFHMSATDPTSKNTNLHKYPQSNHQISSHPISISYPILPPTNVYKLPQNIKYIKSYSYRRSSPPLTPDPLLISKFTPGRAEECSSQVLVSTSAVDRSDDNQRQGNSLDTDARDRWLHSGEGVAKRVRALHTSVKWLGQRRADGSRGEELEK